MTAHVWGFPNPVNEKAARVVAGGVGVLTALTLATQAWWFSAVLAVGFLARVLTGPTLSPLGQLATRVVAPRLGTPREVPGPPKRFAQSIGLAVTTAAAIAWFGFGSAIVAAALLVAAAGVRRTRIDRRVLRRLLDVRPADARRRDPGVDLCGVRRHLGAQPLNVS